jgi:hypothetical protein
MIFTCIWTACHMQCIWYMSVKPVHMLAGIFQYMKNWWNFSDTCLCLLEDFNDICMCIWMSLVQWFDNRVCMHNFFPWVPTIQKDFPVGLVSQYIPDGYCLTGCPHGYFVFPWRFFAFHLGHVWSLQLNHFSRITFLEIEFAGIESIKNQFNSNILGWLYTELIS